MRANKSESESEDGKIDETISNLGVNQLFTKETIAFWNVTKTIQENKKSENELREIYKKKSILT